MRDCPVMSKDNTKEYRKARVRSSSTSGMRPEHQGRAPLSFPLARGPGLAGESRAMAHGMQRSCCSVCQLEIHLLRCRRKLPWEVCHQRHCATELLKGCFQGDFWPLGALPALYNKRWVPEKRLILQKLDAEETGLCSWSTERKQNQEAPWTPPRDVFPVPSAGSGPGGKYI